MSDAIAIDFFDEVDQYDPSSTEQRREVVEIGNRYENQLSEEAHSSLNRAGLIRVGEAARRVLLAHLGASHEEWESGGNVRAELWRQIAQRYFAAASCRAGKGLLKLPHLFELVRLKEIDYKSVEKETENFFKDLTTPLNPDELQVFDESDLRRLAYEKCGYFYCKTGNFAAGLKAYEEAARSISNHAHHDGLVRAKLKAEAGRDLAQYLIDNDHAEYSFRLQEILASCAEREALKFIEEVALHNLNVINCASNDVSQLRFYELE